jgi:hypothetical protein
MNLCVVAVAFLPYQYILPAYVYRTRRSEPLGMLDGLWRLKPVYY